MEGRSLSLLFFFSTLAYVQFARCSPFLQAAGEANLVKLLSHLHSEALGKTEKEQCLKNGGEKAYHDLKAAQMKSGLCLIGVIDPDEFKKDMKELKPTGNYNAVIKKYCGKVPALKECMNKAYPAMDKCLDKSEKIVPKNFKSTSEAIVNFLCPKQESPLSAFIKDGGNDCVVEKEKALEACDKSAFDKYFKPSTMLPAFDLFKFGKQECKDMHGFQECAVKELKKCKKQTAAKFVEAWSTYVIKQTPCK